MKSKFRIRALLSLALLSPISNLGVAGKNGNGAQRLQTASHGGKHRTGKFSIRKDHHPELRHGGRNDYSNLRQLEDYRRRIGLHRTTTTQLPAVNFAAPAGWAVPVIIVAAVAGAVAVLENIIGQ